MKLAVLFVWGLIECLCVNSQSIIGIAESSSTSIGTFLIAASSGDDNSLYRSGLIVNSDDLKLSGYGRRLTDTALFNELTFSSVKLDGTLSPIGSINELANSSGFLCLVQNSEPDKEASIISLRNAQLIVAGSGFLSSGTDLTIENQLDISKQTFYSPDQKLWLELAHNSDNTGGASIVLHPLTISGSNNSNATIAIESSTGNRFGLMTIGDDAIVGWQNPENTHLYLSAATITSSGIIQSQNFITTERALLVGSGATNLFEVPENIQAYFVSNKRENGILIENISRESDAVTAIFFKQGETEDIIGSFSEYGFMIQSENPNGILLNSIQEYPFYSDYTKAISFGVNSQVVAGIDYTGAMTIGPFSSQKSSILTVSSTERGALLPRMTSKQKKKIREPNEGLLVYDTDLRKLCIFTGKRWEVMCSK